MAQSMDDSERDALLEDVRKAARSGARSGSRARGIRLPWVRIALVVLVIAAALGAFFGIKSLVESAATHRGEGLFDVEEDVEGKDLTLSNHGIFGYTAADFAEVVIGDATHPKLLEVYTVNVSDVVTVTDTGLANLAIFSKVQYITFHGTATYTVDLGQVNEYCFVVDNLQRRVTFYVPHAALASIIIPAEQIEFSDVERGILAFGQLKFTPEDQARIQTEAQARMEQKLLDDGVAADANRFARLAVWEIYQPMIAAVAPGYSLNVELM